VHLLLEPLAGNELHELLKGIKGASARKANQILGNTGTSFWMDESYDHIVRSERQHQHLIRYIIENPAKAKLSANQFWLYQSDTDIPVCAPPQGDTGTPACAQPQGDTGIPACAQPQGDTGIPACAQPGSPTQTPNQAQETQAGTPVPPKTQTQTRMSVLRCDIEALVRSGDQAADFEAARLDGTTSYKPHLPAS
ncbi:MAG: transposase, partial [Phycisphaerae bacterium]